METYWSTDVTSDKARREKPQSSTWPTQQVRTWPLLTTSPERHLSVVIGFWKLQKVQLKRRALPAVLGWVSLRLRMRQTIPIPSRKVSNPPWVAMSSTTTMETAVTRIPIPIL